MISRYRAVSGAFGPCLRATFDDHVTFDLCDDGLLVLPLLSR
jgi:hypothetical protein